MGFGRELVYDLLVSYRQRGNLACDTHTTCTRRSSSGYQQLANQLANQLAS